LIYVLQWANFVARVVQEVLLRQISVTSQANVCGTLALVARVQATLALAGNRGGLNVLTVLDGVSAISNALVEPQVLGGVLGSLVAARAEVR
jgi:hypothetical protein